MKNKLSDLNDHLFTQLERLTNEDLNPEQLQMEIERGKAISLVPTLRVVTHTGLNGG